MQSGTATHSLRLLRSPPPNPSRPLLHRRPSPLLQSPFAAGSNGVGSVSSYKAPKPQRDLLREWVSENDGIVRILPIYIGGFSLLAVLLNRSFSSIPPVVDASRAWESLSAATCCRSLVVVYYNSCALQIGFAAESTVENGVAMDVDVKKLLQGSLCRSTMESQKQSYLANLSLYPGKSELPFLPINTQSVILQPLGDKGVAIIGGDTIRGFNNTDQAWITLIAAKLDATLSSSLDILGYSILCFPLNFFIACALK